MSPSAGRPAPHPSTARCAAKKLSLEATKSEIEPLYTVQKVAELLSVDDPFVLDLIKTRKITGLQLDEKTLRITAGSVQRYLAKLAK
jgi:excisionase family DNA binding protein